MTEQSPLRAQPDSRILDQDNAQQGYLFDVDEAHSDDQLLADYRQRYGLSEDPFAQDYSFPLFTGAGRRQLLDQLLHLCQFSNSLLVVLGQTGVGKTRIAHAFMDSLSDQDQICFLSVNSNQSLEGILISVCQTFGIDAGSIPTVENLLASIEAFIAEEAVSEEEGLAVVVLDNAHALDDQTLSVLTALLNNFPQQNRLHLALFGESTLIRRLERLSPESLLLNDFQLQPFGLAESVDYLNFRMEMADYLGPEIFTESMVDPWWRQAQGQLPVLHECAQERLLESVTPKQAFNKRTLPVVHIVSISLLIAIVGVVFLYMGDDESPQPIATHPVIAPAVVQASQQNSSELELTSTQTPVQPLLQTLPQPVQLNQQVQSVPAPVSSESPVVTASPAPVGEEFAHEEVVPLAQLPTLQPKKVEPSSEMASEMEQLKTAVVVVEPAPVVKPQPVEKLEPKPELDVIKPAPNKIVESASAGVATGLQERNILAWKPSEYTVQLLGVSNRKAALDYIAAQPNKKDLLMFKSTRQGRDWFVVITGRYNSSVQARQAIARLPAAQRDAGPWPREVKVIQAEIKSAL